MTKTRPNEQKAGERGMEEPDPGFSFEAGRPVGAKFERIDATVRRKLAMRLPLTDEEADLFANVPGSKEIPPKAIQEGRLDVGHQ